MPNPHPVVVTGLDELAIVASRPLQLSTLVEPSRISALYEMACGSLTNPTGPTLPTFPALPLPTFIHEL